MAEKNVTSGEVDTTVDKLHSVGKEVEEIRGVLFELRRENDSLKTELAKCKEEATEQRRMAEEAKYEAALARERAEDLEQYGRRNNVRIIGVPETDKETVEQCQVCNLTFGVAGDAGTNRWKLCAPACLFCDGSDLFST
nr:hypothetical protein BaRGS_010289 [Batillaria attramentaria]